MPFTSVNPATGEILRSFEPMSDEGTQRLLRQAAEAFESWKVLPLQRRCDLFVKMKTVLLSKKKELALLMAREMGKPVTQGIAEVEKCAWCCDFYAEHAPGFLSPQMIATDAKKSFVAFRPLGVVLAIMPWNFPFWQVLRFAVPALTAGNVAVLKHAQSVFGCAFAIEEVFSESGFPENVFRSLLIDSASASRLIADPLIAAVTITGSVKAGRSVGGEAGKALKKCVLELGGSDPFLILADADLEKASEVGVQARFQNTGQSCIAAKRFIIVESVAQDFEKLYLDKLHKLKMGNPEDPATQLGPMSRIELRDQLHEQVTKSVAQGARLLSGGELPEGPGAFYPPTVLSAVRPGMPAWSEELFGPVASFITVRDEDEAIAVANATEFGLGASVWTRDAARGERIATERIEAGSCFVNAMVKSDPRLPFGGIKHSGHGRELGSFGIHEFVNIKTVLVQET